MSNSTTKALIIFAKYPQKNKVKTRLAKEIGAQKAAELYKSFVEQTLLTARKAGGAGVDIFVNIKPSTVLNKFKKWLGQDLQYMKQQDLGLGAELSAVFTALFNKGYKKVIAIGTDTPDLPVKFINEAYSRLSKCDAVIGPSKDGGYYLIGLNKNKLCSKVFNNINWSTGTVFDSTVKILKENSASYCVLKEWQDIDNLEDLKCYFSRTKTEF
ncbi:MAG: hypothetical protein A3J83_08610 [Elusimicrobia bacterium RIFOXYA2_FULL_40_6]|nr:MAG: hypothetical protein A3J83_08610 [Elusimicrobia bacterium RIFOXYA2_FULL_40_6]